MKAFINLVILLFLAFAISPVASAQVGSSACNAFAVNFEPNPCDTTNAFILPITANTTSNLPLCNSHPISKDVWVKFTVPNYPSNGVRFKMYSNSDSLGYQLFKATGGNCNTLTQQDCHIVQGISQQDLLTQDRNKTDGRFAFYSDEVNVGETYYLRLWETTPQQQGIILKTGIIVLNDNCTNAFDLRGYNCNFGAYDTNEPDSWTPLQNPTAIAACAQCSNCVGNWGANDNAVWYNFSVTANTPQPIQMTLSNVVCYDGTPTLQMAVYTNHHSCDLAQEQILGCNVGSGLVSIDNLTLPVGDYYLFIDGSAGAQCGFQFSSQQLLGNLTTSGNPCPGNPVTLKTRIRPNAGSSYVYQFGGGNIGTIPADTARNYTVINPVAGTYYVTITETDATGSSQTIVANVEVAYAPVPTPTALSPVTLRCGGSCGTIDVGNGLGTYSKYRWSNGDSTQIANVCLRGLYTVTVTNGYGCSATGTTVVDSVNTMHLDASLFKNADCEGKRGAAKIDLVTGGIQIALKYWADNNTSQAQRDSTIRNLNAGRHIIWARDSIGCIASDTILIPRSDTILPPIKITAHAIIGDCNGNNGTVVIDGAMGGTGSPYSFSFNNVIIPNNGSMVFDSLKTGQYTILVSDSLRCKDTLQLLVPQRYYPELNYNAYEPVILVGEAAELRPDLTRGNIIAWTWDAHDTEISCMHCKTPTVKPEVTTTYIVTVTDDNTCTLTRTVTVIVKSRLEVFAPTVITANNDGQNDVFTLFAGHSLANIKVLQIYDRWGGLVFENKNFAPSNEREGWDATVKGKLVELGVYVWRAELEFSDGQKGEMHGDVTVFR